MASPEQVMPRAASALRANAEPDASGDDGLSAFIGVRPRLFGIAYRMLGSVAEAEDIVQDVWPRWQCVERSVVVNPAAYLATATTRLCINAAQCARARRETYPGTWLPEPVDTSADPGLGAERGEALNLAVLLLLEKLSPTERASYVLREAFDYSYCEIAEILRIEEANARQLVSRARQHIEHGRRAPVSAAEQRRLLTVFLDAARNGDMAALEGLFAEDVTSYSDGGGLVRAAAKPVCGRERVARFIAAFSSHFWTGVTLKWSEVNGQWSVLMLRDGVSIALATIYACALGIDQIMWVMRPSKLAGVSSSGTKGGQDCPPSLLAS
jgi:RNA polymerase sigma-70 factor (TIGR02957 family)